MRPRLDLRALDLTRNTLVTPESVQQMSDMEVLQALVDAAGRRIAAGDRRPVLQTMVAEAEQKLADLSQ
jgi:hypothetical protein